MQFLSEAVILSLLGGILGVFIGILGSFILGHALGWPVSIPMEALVVAPIFATGIGVSSGFYPARKATQLDPIAALRQEYFRRYLTRRLRYSSFSKKFEFRLSMVELP
jgi:putative ABC transport system permease protein